MCGRFKSTFFLFRHAAPRNQHPRNRISSRRLREANPRLGGSSAAAPTASAWHSSTSEGGGGLRVVRSEPPSLRALSRARPVTPANRAGVGSRSMPRKCPVQTRVRAVVRRSFGWGRVVNCGRALPPRCSRDSARRPGCVTAQSSGSLRHPRAAFPPPALALPAARDLPRRRCPSVAGGSRSPARCLLALVALDLRRIYLGLISCLGRTEGESSLVLIS